MPHPLRTYREQRGLSQRELAELLGCSRMTIIRWEANARKINSSLVPSISKKTGIPARDLRPDLAQILEGA